MKSNQDFKTDNFSTVKMSWDNRLRRGRHKLEKDKKQDAKTKYFSLRVKTKEWGEQDHFLLRNISMCWLSIKKIIMKDWRKKKIVYRPYERKKQN